MLRQALAGTLFARPQLLLLFAATIAYAACSPPQHFSGKGILKRDPVYAPYDVAAAERRAHATRPLWKLEEPRSDPLPHVGLEQFEASGKYLLLTDPFRVVDKPSGRVLSQDAAFVDAIALLPSGDAVVTDRHSNVVDVRVPSGRRVWSVKAPCARPPPPEAGHIHWYVTPTPAQLARGRIEGDASDVSLIVPAGNDVYVGCANARLVRIDARSGKVLATRDVAPVQQYSSVKVLADNALVAEGWASGAMIQNWIGLVRADTLAPIVPARNQIQFLGTAGSAAVFDGLCMNGCAENGYLPASIYTIDLNSGAMSRSIDLRPDPQLHNHEIIMEAGQGWDEGTVVGERFLLAHAPALYDYGDPRKLRKLRKEPLRLLTGLDSILLMPGNTALAIRGRPGSLTGELIDLTTRPVRVRRTFSLAAIPQRDTNPIPGPGFTLSIALGSPDTDYVAIRSADGAIVRRPCRVRAITAEQVFANCQDGEGRVWRASIAAYDFPGRSHR